MPEPSTSSGLGALIVLIVAILVLATVVIIAIVSLVVVPRNRRPQSALAWLLLIYILPLIGFLLFVTFGSRRLPKRRRDQQDEINTYILETTEGMDRVAKDPPWPPWLEPIVELNRNLGAMPLVGGNTAHLYTDYSSSIAAMTSAVQAATRSVHAEFYIMSVDGETEEFFQALEAAVERGVVVRVLYDHVASLRVPGYRRLRRRLTAMGAQHQAMLPIRPWRGQWQQIGRAHV